MSGQLIISVGREFGSGGHEIARALAERFGLPLYEANMLKNIAEQLGMDASRLERYDELPKNYLTSRTVNGFSNAPEHIISHMQFQYLRERAADGESFVVLGRCSEEVLRDFPGLVSIFVLSDPEFKQERIIQRGAASREEALALMARRDRTRKTYHNQFCTGKWGDSRNYDIAINSARLGIVGTVDILEQYIRARMEKSAR